jgi:hypothetical protein
VGALVTSAYLSQHKHVESRYTSKGMAVVSGFTDQALGRHQIAIAPHSSRCRKFTQEVKQGALSVRMPSVRYLVIMPSAISITARKRSDGRDCFVFVCGAKHE